MDFQATFDAARESGDALQVIKMLEGVVISDVPEALRVDWFGELGRAYYAQCQFRRSLEYLDLAISIWGNRALISTIAELKLNHAYSLMYLGGVGRADELFGSLVSAYTSNISLFKGDLGGMLYEGWAKCHLALASTENAARYKAAIDCAERAIELYKDAGDPQRAGLAGCLLAEIYQAYGQMMSAKEVLDNIMVSRSARELWAAYNACYCALEFEFGHTTRAKAYLLAAQECRVEDVVLAANVLLLEAVILDDTADSRSISRSNLYIAATSLLETDYLVVTKQVFSALLLYSNRYEAQLMKDFNASILRRVERDIAYYASMK